MRFITANTLFNGVEALPGGSVLVIDDQKRLKEIVPESAVEKDRIEHFDGIVTPGFVNAHCHLELSHLKNKIPQHTGLPAFGKQVIVQRNQFSAEEISEHAREADAAMSRHGIVAVGDISNGTDSFPIKTQSSIFYHTFIELIGLNPANADQVFDKGLGLFQRLKERGLAGSLAPHAPYSTSVQLIEKTGTFDEEHHLPLAIHNQESEDEMRFFKGEANGFDELYRFLGLDLSWFKAPGTSSLQAYAAALPEITPSLLVHNTLTSLHDMEAVQAKPVFWCLCPAANLYIENRLPDLGLFTTTKNRVCLGTDSLASNTQLDLIAEANLILKHSTAFSYAALLRAITANAAAALGLEDRFGSFIPGKNTGLNLINYNNGQLHFIQKLA